jgi:alpha-L-rhamnosidase
MNSVAPAVTRPRTPGERSPVNEIPVNVPCDLRVEHLTEPLGLGKGRPRLSWRLPPDTAAQRAYRIRLEPAADSGWISSSDSVLVSWPFAPLAARQQVTWQVQVDTDRGESPWSPPATFETGLFDAADWTASWIRPAEGDPLPASERPAYELRRVITMAKPVVRARLYATAHGIYEAFLGGRRVGDLELTPGFTQYAMRLQIQAYDVTGLIAGGATEFTVLLSDGWFRGQIGITRAHDQWGRHTAFLAQLHAEHPDGTSTVVGTDGSWQSRRSHITAADLVGGQSEDRRLTGRAGGWEPVRTAEIGYAQLVSSPSPPVRRVQEIPARSVTRLADGHLVVDLGQNINGWIRLGNLGPAGTELVLVHGEALDAAGDVTTDHLRPDVPFLPEPLAAGMIDRVISAGQDGDVFEPRHTTHGFRYIRVEGHPGDLTVGDVTGVVVHTDMRRTGWFTCSDDRINALHEAAAWSFRDNACDIPTDCPHRERAGWTGDWQLYVPSAAFLYDVAGFSAKWLRDVATDQWDDGTIANISPAAPAEGIGSPVRFLNGSAGWGDAIVIVPWEIYRAYGDVQLLAELWPNMVRWLDRTQRMAAAGRHPSRTGPVRPHERYLWDTGFHWGEWLEPGDDMSGSFEEFAGRDKSDVATAYYARSAELMSRIAAVLGRGSDAARYADLAESVRAAWQAEFVGADGDVHPATQAAIVRALTFGLLPDHLRERAAAQLVQLIRHAGTHLGTGFLATPDLLPALADTGHADIAYELLFQDTPPSWLSMVGKGATTVWERWLGIDDDGMPHESLNHYSKGAVISFLHRYTAGIRIGGEPAYRAFRIQPVPGSRLTSAAAAHESPYGRIESSWRADRGLLYLDVTVPPGTTAEVILPGRPACRTGPGLHSFVCPQS